MFNSMTKRLSTSMISRLRNRLDLPGLAKSPLRRSISVNRQRYEVLAEDVFRRILCWERKRAERSGKGCLLMLGEMESLRRAEEGQRTLRRIAAALYKCTRDTDIVGWYREGGVLGAIFTEVNKANGCAPESLIRAKVTAELRDDLGAERFGQIHLSFYTFPDDWDQADSRGPADKVLYPDLVERSEEQRAAYVVKRLVDIAGSLLALVLGSPLWVAISLAIKLTSKGPILFKQERVGWYGRRFTFLKFRSMKCANDPGIHREYVRRLIAGAADSTPGNGNQKAVYKIPDDPRVTRVGKFLRTTSLDELPQFINVLRGEMSLVGPRPPIPYEVEVYQPWHRSRVLEARPGITGLWQVRGRSRLNFNDMVRLDLRYARTWSLGSDLRIALQTPRAVLSCQGAY